MLVACFHPRHAFQGLEEDDVLNYEKRSPHPTINLLRYVDRLTAAFLRHLFISCFYIVRVEVSTVF